MNKAILASALLGATAMGASAADNDSALDGMFNSQITGFADRFTFGSYGELQARAGDGADNVDLHRLVLFTDIKITDRLKFRSEVEFEHLFRKREGGDLEIPDGPTEIEQAYFEYTVRDDLFLTAGVQLVPVGIINPTHEPTTFFGVERPNVDRVIIPTTWWEGGIGVVRTYENGLQLDVLVHTAMDQGRAGNIRSGRPKLHISDYTDTHSWGVLARAKYTGIQGVELASSFGYQHDVSSQTSGSQNAYLLSGHAIYNKGGFSVRALAAYWKFDGFNSAVEDEQWGAYLEPSYTWDTKIGKVGVFARYAKYKYYTGSKTNDFNEFATGVNYWLNDKVVIKADYVNVDEGSRNNETVNMGVGYAF